MKGEHKDEYISFIETKLQESEKYNEAVIKEKKEHNMEIHRLVENLEKMKIENKELKTVTKGINVTAKKTQGDVNDKEDNDDLDSEKEIVWGKNNGFRRNSPQSNSSQVFTFQQ